MKQHTYGWMRVSVLCAAAVLFSLGITAGAAERVFDGQLTDADLVLPTDGSYYKMHEFTAREGDQIIVDMTSSDFDTFLFVHSPGGGVHQNDDHGDGTNSRVSVTADQTGTWKVFANSFGRGATGTYRIHAQTVNASEFDTQTFTGRLGAGSAKRPDNNAPYEEHTLDLQAGQDVIISLSSEDFDTMVFLHSPSGQSFSDDDGGEGTNSQLSVTTDQAGTWRIVATSYGSDADGSYTMNVRARRAGRTAK